MCIASDFQLYYSDSFVGVRGEGEEVLPFYVTGVDYQQWYKEEAHAAGRNTRSLAEELYSKHDDVIRALEFHGHVISGDGNRSTRTVPMAELILENPELGYIKRNNRWVWVTYEAQHSAKKGLMSRRTNQDDLNNDQLYQLFNIRPEGDRLHNDFVLSDNKLNYKGTVIGNQQESTLVVKEDFKIMESLLKSITDLDVIFE